MCAFLYVHSCWNVFFSLIDNSTTADSLAYLLQNMDDIQLALKTVLQSLDIQQRGAGEQDFVMDTSGIILVNQGGDSSSGSLSIIG